MIVIQGMNVGIIFKPLNMCFHVHYHFTRYQAISSAQTPTATMLTVAAAITLIIHYNTDLIQQLLPFVMVIKNPEYRF